MKIEVAKMKPGLAFMREDTFCPDTWYATDMKKDGHTLCIRRRDHHVEWIDDEDVYFTVF